MGPPQVLFERLRDGLQEGTDLYLATLPLTGPRPGTPLVPAARLARLLDVTRGPDGAVHLLWTAETRGVPGVFYGRLDLQGRRIADQRRVSEGVRSVRMGRLVVPAGGEVHVFWMELKTNFSHPHESGLYWNRRADGVWGRSQLLVPLSGVIATESYAPRRLLGFTFDAVADRDEVVLAWADPYAPGEGGLHVRRLTTEWSGPETLGTGSFRGVALVRDTAGTLHLFDWTGGPELDAFRGELRHRTAAAGAAWSAPETLDGAACCIAAAAGPRGALEAVWERRTGERSIAVRRRLSGGVWSADMDPGNVAGEDAIAPKVTVLPTGRIVVAWSSRSGNGTGLRAQAFPWPLP